MGEKSVRTCQKNSSGFIVRFLKFHRIAPLAPTEQPDAKPDPFPVNLTRSHESRIQPRSDEWFNRLGQTISSQSAFDRTGWLNNVNRHQQRAKMGRALERFKHRDRWLAVMRSRRRYLA